MFLFRVFQANAIKIPFQHVEVEKFSEFSEFLGKLTKFQ